MTTLESTSAVTASIVPFDPSVGVTVVASIALAVFVVFMLVLTFTSPPEADSSYQTESSQSSNAVENAEPTD